MSIELRNYLNQALDLEYDYLTTLPETEQTTRLYVLLSMTLLEKMKPGQLLSELLKTKCVYPSLIKDLKRLLRQS